MVAPKKQIAKMTRNWANQVLKDMMVTCSEILEGNPPPVIGGHPLLFGMAIKLFMSDKRISDKRIFKLLMSDKRVLRIHLRKSAKIEDKWKRKIKERFNEIPQIKA